MGCFFYFRVMRLSKRAEESYVTMTEMVMPNDTNPLNKLMGGKLMEMIDVAGAISAQRHCNDIVVTASVDNISFKESIDLGNVVTIKAQVTRAFRTSMEVYVQVFSENIPKRTKSRSNEAFLTFVAVNTEGKPIEIPEVLPESDVEIKLYEAALRRRELRLILSGKLTPENAPELKNLFQ